MPVLSLNEFSEQGKMNVVLRDDLERLQPISLNRFTVSPDCLKLTKRKIIISIIAVFMIFSARFLLVFLYRTEIIKTDYPVIAGVLTSDHTSHYGIHRSTVSIRVQNNKQFCIA